MSDVNPLGTYLMNRRTKLDPASFGLAGGRRRTPGLRREEVAQRADISTTWYTWLEQGRGGSPSAEVLDRIAQALTLTEVEREHLFLIGLGRPPEMHYRGSDPITPRLQRLLDMLAYSPAIVRTPTWDVVAWNHAAACVFTDYALLPPKERNILRRLFCGSPEQQLACAAHPEWESMARFIVAAFRIDAARAGADAEVASLVDELSRSNPAFASMWRDNNVQTHGDGSKQLDHPLVGMITLEFSAFMVDGRPDLGLIVYNPATPYDRKLIQTLVEPQCLS